MGPGVLHAHDVPAPERAGLAMVIVTPGGDRGNPGPSGCKGPCACCAVGSLGLLSPFFRARTWPFFRARTCALSFPAALRLLCARANAIRCSKGRLVLQGGRVGTFFSQRR